MKLNIILATAALTLPAAAFAQPPTPAAVDTVFSAYTPATPGCAIGIEAAGRPPLLRAYGSTDLEHGLPNTPDTVFEAGSVSKQFTAAAALLLVQDGKIALGDDVRKYVPELPDYGRPITIAQLLSHTSGLRDWGEVEDIAGWPRGDRAYTMRDVLRVTSRQKSLNYQPGAAWSYTNTGFNLLALIVERVSGQSFSAFTRERLFKPLGMTHSQWRDDYKRIVPGRAIAYDHQGGAYELNMPFESAYGNGGLLTTVGDLLAWNRALTEGSLGPAVTAQLQQQAKLNDGQTVSYAGGLFIADHHGLREVSHGGATAGYRAWLGRYPDQKVSVALLCNVAEANSAALAHHVADLYLPPLQTAAEKAAQKTVAEPPLADRAGLYADDRNGSTLSFVAMGQGLGMANGMKVEADADGRFSIAGTEIAFLPDGRLRLGHGGDAWTLTRMAAYAPTAADLAQLVGRYHSDEAEVDYAITLEKGALKLAVVQRPDTVFALTPAYADAFGFNGNVLRPVRDADGKVIAVRISGSRVWSLRMDRVG